jgi:hypothetical protein
MWHDRLRDEPRYREAVAELWPAAVAVLPEGLRPQLAERADRPLPSDNGLRDVERGRHSDELRELWEEMTMVRRSVPGATW